MTTNEAALSPALPQVSQTRDAAIQGIVDRIADTDYLAEIADAMQMLEPASLQPVKPSKYILLMVTVIENREQLQYFLSQNVTLHVSKIDGKTRAFTKVRE